MIVALPNDVARCSGRPYGRSQDERLKPHPECLHCLRRLAGLTVRTVARLNDPVVPWIKPTTAAKCEMKR